MDLLLNWNSHIEYILYVRSPCQTHKLRDELSEIVQIVKGDVFDIFLGTFFERLPSGTQIQQNFISIINFSKYNPSIIDSFEQTDRPPSRKVSNGLNMS